MFTAKHNIQERKEDLENIKEIIVEFKERLSRKQEKLKIIIKTRFQKRNVTRKIYNKDAI